MSEFCVVVVDGARARLFSLAENESDDVGGPDLVEEKALANPEVEQAGRDLYSDAKSGRNAAPQGAGAHGYDDHRNRHIEELERRFAKDVAAEAVKSADRLHAHHLVLVAEKRMLGYLRAAVSLPPAALFDVVEVAKDLTKMSPRELHEHLAADSVLPQRKAPAL